MKKVFTLLLTISALTYFLSCKNEPNVDLDSQLTNLLESRSKTGSIDWYRMPESDDYAALPNQDAKNPVTAVKVELGKMLFFETGMGLEAKYPFELATFSCSSCHVPERGFTAGRFQGIADGAIGFGQTGEGRAKHPLYLGDEVDAQGARPLPTMNLTYVSNALWAGTFGSFNVNEGTESVWNQDTLVEINYKGFQGLEANNQRALIVHRQIMDKAIADSLGYTAMFDQAFPEIPVNERYSRKTVAFAIAAYFRTILTNQAPFQEFVKGNTGAMSDQQKRGAALFFGKAGCVNCHNSPSLNSVPHEFFAIGVKNHYQTGNEVFRTGPSDKRNLGRGGFTSREEDMNKFKVPQLYNLKDVGFYFHGASKRSLRDVVEYFNEGIPENPDIPKSQISGFFHPLGLTNAEMDDLTEFLETGLFDPNMLRYKPSVTMSGNCFPNNDPLSRIEMGCN
ncbi:MAG: hypothetical protein JNJ57_14905 [Saprospiraceae bacterium]|nr:hypothetical protein [Saprospiraceae bacterium]